MERRVAPETTDVCVDGKCMVSVEGSFFGKLVGHLMRFTQCRIRNQYITDIHENTTLFTRQRALVKQRIVLWGLELIYSV